MRFLRRNLATLLYNAAVSYFVQSIRLVTHHVIGSHLVPAEQTVKYAAPCVQLLCQKLVLALIIFACANMLMRIQATLYYASRSVMDALRLLELLLSFRSSL